MSSERGNEYLSVEDHFRCVERHIQRAEAARSAYLGHLVARALGALRRSLKRFGAALERGHAAELDRRAIEADAFLRRSVPRY